MIVVRILLCSARTVFMQIQPVRSHLTLMKMIPRAINILFLNKWTLKAKLTQKWYIEKGRLKKALKTALLMRQEINKGNEYSTHLCTMTTSNLYTTTDHWFMFP